MTCISSRVICVLREEFVAWNMSGNRSAWTYYCLHHTMLNNSVLPHGRITSESTMNVGRFCSPGIVWATKTLTTSIRKHFNTKICYCLLSRNRTARDYSVVRGRGLNGLMQCYFSKSSSNLFVWYRSKWINYSNRRFFRPQDKCRQCLKSKVRQKLLGYCSFHVWRM